MSGPGSIAILVRQHVEELEAKGQAETAVSMRRYYARALAKLEGKASPPKFAFSRRIASARGWQVIKSTLMVRDGRNDVVVGLLSDAPPSGRRVYLWTMPLYASEFALYILSYSMELSYSSSDVETDNSATTSNLIDRYNSRIDEIAQDQTYANYSHFLAGLAYKPLIARNLWVHAATAVMASDQVLARDYLDQIGRVERDPRGYDDRARLLAKTLLDALDNSLDHGRVMLRDISASRRLELGWAAPLEGTP